MNHEEIHSLLGVYALDALEGAEHDEVTAHLATCSTCRSEVQRHREVAALLAVTTADDDAIGALREPLWEKIEGAIAPALITPINAVASERSARQRRYLRLTSVAAAALLVVVGILQWQVGRLDGKVSSLQNRLRATSVDQQLASALRSPHHLVVSLDNATHSVKASVVLTSSGTSFLVNNALGAVDSAHTYQLWALSRGHIVSLGVLGRSPRVVEFQFELPMSVVMVNVEPAGGSPTPSTPVLASAQIA